MQRVITLILGIGLSFSLLVLGSGMRSWRLPGNQQGYAPKQPIDFSHRLHAGELQMDCRFCHWNAQQSRFAGIPSSDTCMKCHNFVTAAFDVLQDEIKKADKEKRKPKMIISPELRKLYESLGLGEDLKPLDGATPESIAWVRVHNLPDYVYFDHSAHVTAGVTCQRCHGPVESTERMRQAETLSMSWCINCHREANEKGINGQAMHAATNCATCHY